ncbi:hypothetical protein [Methanopyrus sp.]
MVKTVKCCKVPEDAFVLRAVLAYDGLDRAALETLVRKAVILGLRVRHEDSVSGVVILEGFDVEARTLRRLPGPSWCKVTFVILSDTS